MQSAKACQLISSHLLINLAIIGGLTRGFYFKPYAMDGKNALLMLSMNEIPFNENVYYRIDK